MLTITRSFEFCAGHRLHRADWSDQKNREIFGLCANPNGHGHNYRLDVTVTGPVDPETGMILNLRQLKEIVRERVIAEVDHKNLNLDVPWMQGVNPTTENFAEKMWERLNLLLRKEAPKAQLHQIVLQETPNNKVTRTAAP